MIEDRAYQRIQEDIKRLWEQTFRAGFEAGKLEGQKTRLETDGAYRAGMAAGVKKGREEYRREKLIAVQQMLEEGDKP